MLETTLSSLAKTILRDTKEIYMLTNAKISIIGNISKSLINPKKDIVGDYFSSKNKIERTAILKFSDKDLKKYCDFIGWTSDEIPPTYPYALLTHMQISMVTDRKFPFSPFGIIHKSERIETLAPLTRGKWQMHCSIPLFRKVEKGFEIEMISALKINGKIVWRSTTTAFKQLKRGLSRFNFKPIEVTGQPTWNLASNHGRKYAFLSNNFDLIHFSKFTAKMMGLKQPIMHGMFTAARGLSEVKELKYPFKVDFRFVAPIYLPSKIVYQETENGFGVYNESGKRLHLEASILE